MLRRVLSEYWRKETEKSKVFCGVVGLDWTLNDRFFASRVHCMLRRVLSEYWRKETEISKVFCGVVGLDGRCSAQAEQRKKPVAVVHLPGAYLSTETNLVPIRGVMKEEFDTGQTDTHTHTRNENRSAWTCWRSIVCQ